MPSLNPTKWFFNRLSVGAKPAVAQAANRPAFEPDLIELSKAGPTLLLYRKGRQAQGEDTLGLLELIAAAGAIRVSGEEYVRVLLSPDIADQHERFVGGEQGPSVPESVLTTVMFTDLVGSTERASSVGDRRWRELLSEHHSLVRRELARFRGEERDVAGDGFFATFAGPARAIRAAEAIVTGLQALGLGVRVGIHVGECEIHDGKPAGIVVITGARVAAAAQPGEILVTGTARDLVVGADLEFAERGEYQLKGLPESVKLYAVSTAAGLTRLPHALARPEPSASRQLAD